MNIGMILNGEYPPDIRITKECDALAKYGVNVFVLSSIKGIRPNLKTEKTYRNATVCYTAFDYPDRIRKFLNKVRKITGMQTLLQRKILRFIDDYKIDVIHAHDLPMADAAVKPARIKKITLVSDLHENYPYLQMSGKKKSTLKFKRWFRVEKRTVRSSSFVIVTCNEMKNRIIQEHGTNPQKIIVVSNVYGDEFENLKVNDILVDKYKKRKMFLYTGILNQRKGAKTLIEAIYHLKEYPEILLCLVGVSKEDKKIRTLRDMVSCRKIENQVEFVQWQSIDRIYSYIMASYACIVPFERNIQNDCSSPHKLFQYMACGKPVIVSDCPSIANIVNQNNCGLVFAGGNSKDLSKKMLFLCTHPEVSSIMGKNGRDIIRNRYNFKIEGEKLFNLYKKIAHSLCYNNNHKSSKPN